jgi:hypothetical protein
MYTVKIENKITFEILEAPFDTFKEASRAANIAYFAAGDNIEISIIGPDGNEIEDW